VALDFGRGAHRLTGARDLFLSHGHMDHALGLPYVLSQRNLHKLGPCRVFCPAAVREAVAAFLEAAAALEEAPYRYELRGLEPGDRVEVGKGRLVEAFAVDHVLPSLGYHLIRRRRSLAPPLRGLPGVELVRRREAGEAIEQVEDAVELSYCADTADGVFELEPRLFEARVLLIECTFLGPELVGKARTFGHLHLQDLVPYVSRFANEAVVLTHLSRRHRLGELRTAAERALAGMKPRLIVFGERDEPDAVDAGKQPS
jgi:ribonuclease Z